MAELVMRMRTGKLLTVPVTYAPADVVSSVIGLLLVKSKGRISVLFTVTVYVFVVTVSPAVTNTVIVLLPWYMFMLPEGDPDTTGVPFTFTVEQVSATVGVTVMEVLLVTVAVYEMVPDANPGVSVPEESVRPDRFALDELQLVAATV
jgi:hypothetical protein